MLKLIGKIRRQPKSRRDNIAFGIASGFTFVIGALWLFNAPNTFSGVLSATDANGNPEPSFFETISSQAAAVRESLRTDSSDGAETESLKELMDEYRASSTQATSTQFRPVTASSTATSTSVAPAESFERFDTNTSYELGEPREVRLQVVPKATTSTTTLE
jgi:hypothetical protein